MSIIELEKHRQPAAKRLPCRGCTENCKNYPVCDGKLWRMPDPGIKTASSSDKSGSI